MKAVHILALVVIAVAISIIISTFGDAGQYDTFDVARANQGETFHVVGVLDKSKDQYYDPTKNPDYYTFYMLDTMHNEMKIILHDVKPSDIEQVEKVVVIGSAVSDTEFEAKEVLRKCPSKYKKQDIETVENPR